MQIEVKYGPEDTVYVIDHNKVYKRVISAVKTSTTKRDDTKAAPNSIMPTYEATLVTNITYILKPYGDESLKSEFKQSEVFRTKDELLKSL